MTSGWRPSAYDVFAYLAPGALVIFASDWAFWNGALLRHDPRLGVDVLLILVVYVVGHVVALMAGLLIGALVHWRVLPDPSWIIPARKPRQSERGPRRIRLKGLPEDMEARILERLPEDVRTQEGVFHHCLSMVRRQEATRERAERFAYLYALSGNVATAGLLAAVLLLVGGLIGTAGELWWAVAVLSLVGAAAMLARYVRMKTLYYRVIFNAYAEATAN